MNSDIDWIFAFIEIAIGIYSLLKGMIDFTYSGLPKYSNGNTPILNWIKSFEYLHEAFCTRRNLYAFFSLSIILYILIHMMSIFWDFEFFKNDNHNKGESIVYRSYNSSINSESTGSATHFFANTQVIYCLPQNEKENRLFISFGIHCSLKKYHFKI